MYVLDNLYNDVIDFYKNKNILSCAYLEKNYDNNFNDANLYLIFNDSNITFRDLSNDLDIINLLNNKTSVIYKKFYNWDKSIHIITSDKISIRIHITNYIYNYEDLKILFNPYNISVKDEVNNSLQMTLAIKEFIIDLNSCLREESENKFIGLLYLNKLYNDLVYFLCNFYLDYSVYKEDIHANFNYVLKKMDKGKVHKFNQIIKLLNMESSKDCLRLIVWFFDEFIINLPISVMQSIDIDLYTFIKELILK